MDLQQTWRVLRAGWWVVVLSTLVGAAVAAGIVLASTPMYTADTRLFVSTTNTTDDVAGAVQGSQLAQARVSSYASYLTDLQLAQAVVDDLDLDMTADELAGEISASVVPDTVILDVTVTDPSPARAQAIAESIGQQFNSLIGAIETPEGQTTSPIRVAVIAPPELPAAPSSPKPAQDLVIGLVLGFVLGCGLVLLRHRTDTRIRTSDQAAELGRGPGLGVIPLDDQLSADKSVLHDREAPSAESFRQLRTSMDFVDVDSPPRTVLVSSSLPGEGKTTVAVNLAIALTAAGRRVVLVEADLRRPRVTRYLGLVSGAGLTSVLNGSAGLDDVLQPVGDGSLQVLAAGPTPPNPSELLASGQMQRVLADLLDRADVVLLDGPPLLPVSDAGGLAPSTDGVVLCVRYGQTTTQELTTAARTLERVGARTLGTVFTFVPRRAAGNEGLGYTYHYGEDPAPGAGPFARLAHRRSTARTAKAAAKAGKATSGATTTAAADRPTPASPGPVPADRPARPGRVQAAAGRGTAPVAPVAVPAAPVPVEPHVEPYVEPRVEQELDPATPDDSAGWPEQWSADDEHPTAAETPAEPEPEPEPAPAPSPVPPRPAIAGPDAPTYPQQRVAVVKPRETRSFLGRSRR
ncbi:non-specific protein-tyrosine kinase [Klenkia soli]|uniref:Non-specific protein-tyrosine kinase n=1 Tax=Klenkia soli TaxID=1052260 RepID=A0A1H0MU99_9ACTN|nr:polysaccharide biosynthesis tyrosine autokinase [Klenkia soli]SDO83951.1 non-specific protein-tyrosine kinase [Klenkia soli]